MVIVNDKVIEVDLSNNLYDSLGIPERDEDIAIYIEYVKKCLENGTIKRDTGLLKQFADHYIARLDTALSQYRRTKDITRLICDFNSIDTMIKKAELKEKEHAGELSNVEVNKLIPKITSKWTIISNPEYRDAYDKELLQLRKMDMSHNLQINLSNTAYKEVGLPETAEGIVKKVEAVRDQLKNMKNDENEMLQYFSESFVQRIDEALAEYNSTGDVSVLVSRYAGVDIMIKRTMLDLQVKNGEISKKDASDLLKKLTDNWNILSNPELKRIYDHELMVLRRIQAIQDENERKRLLRNKLVIDEISENYDRSEFDRSSLGGDKVRKNRFDNLPEYAWSIREYPQGKELIFSTNTFYRNHPELDEKVEVYAVGEFRWGNFLRRDRNGLVKPTIENELCEVVCVKKKDKDGKEVTFYGIAETRDLGEFSKMTEDEIRENERQGKEVILVMTPEEKIEFEHERRLAEIRGRNRRKRPNQTYEVVKVTRPTNFGKKLIRFNRVLDKIGLEIPEEMIPTNVIEKRIPIANASKMIEDVVPMTQRSQNKKYNVLVMQPVRHKLDSLTQSEFARIRLSDWALVQAKEKNGYFIGALADKKDTPSQMVLDDTIRACQFATKNPGTIRTSTNRLVQVGSLEEAIVCLAKRDMERQRHRRTERKSSETIDFYGE